MKLLRKLGELVGRIASGNGSVERWLHLLLLEYVSRYTPKAGEEVQIGTTRVLLLNESYTVRILAMRSK